MRCGYPSLSCGLLVALVLCAAPWTRACQEKHPEHGLVLDWLRQLILARLGLEEAPVPGVPEGPGRPGGPGAHRPLRSRVGRAAPVEGRQIHQDASQVILFPSSDSTCAHTSDPPSHGVGSFFTYYFQPSTHTLESTITSGHFWFYSGDGPLPANASAPLYVLTAQQQLVLAADAPERLEEGGWAVYRLGRAVLSSLADGPFAAQVRCPTCACRAEADKTPFLHLRARSRAPDRSRRSSIPWSLSALDRLQRPAQDGGDYDDCHREELNISFQELGWENWIVHPKVFTFHYCHGNCSSQDRITTLMGIRQCCAAVPGTMKPLRVRTTSDRGYSVKYETLPNIIAEDCTCI
ncbi:inhibin alpha chain [Anguilla anguilla]|uniref:inhibin alpha chain n=1 Tax=Anguilla anguilla TaxID=7936 RepID=UPI0015ADAF0F|nr:inhibin alpha chain [Anguilla anguilla]